MSGTPAARVSPHPIELGTLSRYLLALLLLAALLALRLALFEIEAGFAFMTFFPGVAVMVLLAGPGPACLYTVLAALVAVLVFQPPYGALDLNDTIGFLFYCGSGGVTILALVYYQRWMMAEREQANRSLEALAEAQAQLRRGFDETPLGIAHIGLDGRALRCNPRLCRMLGRGERELLASELRQLIHPEDLTTVEAPARRLLDGALDAWRVELRLRRHGGDWLWTAVTVSLARKPDGTPDYLLATIEDIDARHRAEQQLRVSEARFQTFMDAMPAMAWLLDQQGRFVYMNPTWERVLGQPRELWLGRSRAELVQPDVDNADAGEELRLLAEGRVLDGVESFGLRDGAPRLWRTVRFAAPADGGQALLGGIGVEITGEVAAIEALRESEARLALALDSADMGSWQWEPATGDARWNRREFELLGLDPDRHRASQALFLQAIHPEDRDRVMQWIEHSLASRSPFQNEFRVVHPDGEVRWLAAAGRVTVDAEGRLIRMAGTNFDITARKLAEQALRDSEMRIQAIIDNASDAIISADAQGRVTLFNPAAERMFGIGAAQMIGAPLERLLPPETRGAHGTQLAQFARSGISRRRMGSGRVSGLHADGSRIELEASISQASVEGAVVLTAMLRDITERTRAERRLIAYQLELAGLNRRLLEQEKDTTRRLAQALHDELGQTLAALRMQFDASRAALGAVSDAGTLRRIDLLISEANRQVRQVLTELRPPMLDELGLVAALDNEMRRQSETAIGPRLSLLVDDALRALRWPADVEFSAFMIAREAIYNAIRHADARDVEVIVEGGEGRLELRVEDDGIGLSDASTRSRPGHLGLVGMRERARAIGATLELGTTEGQGTRVHLTWQAPPARAALAPSGEAAGAAAARPA